jgi:acyl carrier protein
MGASMDARVRDQLRRFVSEEILFEDPSRTQVRDDTPLLALIDSFGLMRLVTFLEEDLGLVVDDSDITPENFQTISDVERLITSKAGSE